MAGWRLTTSTSGVDRFVTALPDPVRIRARDPHRFDQLQQSSSDPVTQAASSTGRSRSFAGRRAHS